MVDDERMWSQPGKGAETEEAIRVATNSSQMWPLCITDTYVHAVECSTGATIYRQGELTVRNDGTRFR